MAYYIAGIVILITLIVLYLHYANRLARQKKLEKLRALWGNIKDEYFDFDRVGRYAALPRDKPAHRLTQQTLDDVDFFALFSFVDRTNSKIGQQFLFDKLVHPVLDGNALRQFDEQAAFFSGNVQLREAVQHELHHLSGNDAYYITSLLGEKLLERPAWFRLVLVSVSVVIALMALSVKYPVLLIWLIIPVALNMFLHYWNKNNSFRFARSFPQLSVLIDVAERLWRKNIHADHKQVTESSAALKPFQWKMRLLGLVNEGGLKDDLNQVATYLSELLKALFLIEVFTLFHLTHELEKKKNAIYVLFTYAGAIDAALSVASLRAGALKTCKPAFISPAKEMIITNVYHPLIDHCVPNDIHIRSKSILITGSNMSGKTTFLRTLVINSILAQTIYTCFADEFRSPLVSQFTSIRIDDNLFAGKSYYFEEVNIMASLINAVAAGGQNLYVLDEVFKGTNTIERIAAAKAILSYLNRHNNLVIVSTHDIELADMLAREYDLYHFTETIEDNQLHFDHKIKAGQLKTRNAIRILEMSNYPAEIINEAKDLSVHLTNIKQS